MNKLLVLQLTSVCLFCLLVLSSPVYCQSIDVGVTKGDSFTYASSYLWIATNSSKPVPAEAIEANQTSQIQIIVTSVSGSLVNATKTYRFQNGTSQTVDGYADFSSGDNEEVGAFFFVNPNLSIDDKVYPSGLYADIINQTLQRTVAGSEREVVLDSSTFKFEYGNPSQVVSSQIDYYFDRQTGACVEQREQTTITDKATGQSETSISLVELKQTNLWGSNATVPLPILLTLVLVVVFLVVIILVGLFYRSRIGK
jgi:hypothetical protein